MKSLELLRKLMIKDESSKKIEVIDTIYPGTKFIEIRTHFFIKNIYVFFFFDG